MVSLQKIALVTYSKDGTAYTGMRRAWYPNIKTQRVESLDPKLVTCAAQERP